jgi:hypothetical protein
MSQQASALDIVRNGQPTSAIVIPDQALPGVEYAALEMQYHLRAATGAILPIRMESQVPVDDWGRLYLGCCIRTTKVGLRTEDLPPNGFHIKMRDGNLYLAGHDSDGPVLSSRGIEGSLHDNKTRLGTLFAVYEFLDKHLGVRWLWPGKLGEVIPQQKNIEVAQWDQTYKPQLIHTRLRDYYTKDGIYPQRKNGWSSPQVAAEHFHDQAVWMRRHRIAQGQDMDYPHAFTTWWDRYHKSHPEIFAMGPGGKRTHNGKKRGVQLCLAEPNAWTLIIQEWRRRVATEALPYEFINATSNDADGNVICRCDRCESWDGIGNGRPLPRELTRDELRAQRGWREPDERAKRRAERAAKFYLTLQREGEKHDPNAREKTVAYTFPYPPTETELNDRIVIGIEPGMYFPLDEKKLDWARQQWAGWDKSGVRQFLRPNLFHFGHNLPFNISRKFGDYFSFCYERGMMGTDFDLVPGAWASQGPAYYVLGRIHRHGDRNVKQILDEYYSGFGPAKQAVKIYFDHWEQLSDSVTQKSYDQGWKARGISDNPEHRIFIWSEHFFTPQVMAEGRSLLEKARLASHGDELAEQRVEFLSMGLKDAELTMAVSVAFRAYGNGGDGRNFAQALKRLDAYRESIDKYNVANMGYLYSKESLHWSRPQAATMLSPLKAK